MKVIILESSTEISLNQGIADPATLPTCWVKSRIQPVLGNSLDSFTDFVPVHEHSGYIKNLLSLQETDSTPPTPIFDAPKELQKAEKIIKGEDQSGTPMQENVLGENFEQAAKNYLKTDKPESIEKFPEIAESEQKPPPVSQHNDADIATIISAATPKAAYRRPKPQRKSPKKLSKSKAKGRKKNNSSKKKGFSTFRVVTKKR